MRQSASFKVSTNISASGSANVPAGSTNAPHPEPISGPVSTGSVALPTKSSDERFLKLEIHNISAIDPDVNGPISPDRSVRLRASVLKTLNAANIGEHDYAEEL